ncbi:MAG: di-heme oxidoredictase family protein [Deltaproteobacteria bacterium]|nr:di-heme oxidoredictase family protein [Deltaproteobacteria bacterium]
MIVVACGDDDHRPRASTPTATATAYPTATATPAEPLGDPLSGGAGTVENDTIAAFGQPARNLPLDQRTAFFTGNALFNRDWVMAGSSTSGSDGLGPVFNARSCSSCHFRDGRGAPPMSPDDSFVGLLFRLSIPGTTEEGAPLGDPNYGTQLNQASILRVPSEGRAAVVYEDIAGTYADGDAYTLRRPTYEFVALAFGPLDPQIQVSPRTAPFLIGLGLLEAVDEEAILSRVDPDDSDGDGISGRANYVWDVKHRRHALGRFGWKANVPSLEQQNSGAFNGDIGITTPLFPDQNCAPVQAECLASPNGGEPEADQLKVDRVTFYSRYLAVPARRDIADADVLRGEQLFRGIGCGGCHTPTMLTGAAAEAPLALQRIHPYSDLLLHDMGEGLADGRPDFAADGREWRTPPLWGVGLIGTVNGHDLLLHDGRARGFAEAILWHGGEGSASREAFRHLSREERAALIRFLESL